MCKVQVNRGCILNVCALLHKLQLLLPPPLPQYLVISKQAPKLVHI